MFSSYTRPSASTLKATPGQQALSPLSSAVRSLRADGGNYEAGLEDSFFGEEVQVPPLIFGEVRHSWWGEGRMGLWSADLEVKAVLALRREGLS